MWVKRLLQCQPPPGGQVVPESDEGSGDDSSLMGTDGDRLQPPRK